MGENGGEVGGKDGKKMKQIIIELEGLKRRGVEKREEEDEEKSKGIGKKMEGRIDDREGRRGIKGVTAKDKQIDADWGRKRWGRRRR